MRRVKCITEPRGCIHLEGFQLNQEYELIEKGDFYKLYKDGEFIDQTSMKRKFWKYFTEIK